MDLDIVLIYLSDEVLFLNPMLNVFECILNKNVLDKNYLHILGPLIWVSKGGFLFLFLFLLSKNTTNYIVQCNSTLQAIYMQNKQQAVA